MAVLSWGRTVYFSMAQTISPENRGKRYAPVLTAGKFIKALERIGLKLRGRSC